jgi:hypothetical protein
MLNFDFFDLFGHLLPSTELVNFANNFADAFLNKLGTLTIGFGGIWREMTCVMGDPIAQAFTNSYNWIFLIFGLNC